nr:ComF family protein [Streptomyces dysideae]
MRGWWQDLTDLVLPAECGGCGRPRTVLCSECCAVLSGAAPRRVRPVPEPPGLPVVHAAARYGDEVRAALLAHKERGVLALAAPLGVALAGAVRAGLQETSARADGAVPRAGRLQEEAGVPGGGAMPVALWGRASGASVVGLAGAGAGAHGGYAGQAAARGEFGGAGAPVLLVPVPSGRGTVRARGHDPARRIALAAAGELRRTGTPARVLAVLRQRRAVADQSGLNSRQRMENLAGALAVVPGGARLLGDGLIVLVDDLMTTGASLAEAARAVRAGVGEEAVASGRAVGELGVHGGVAGPGVRGRAVAEPGTRWRAAEEADTYGRTVDETDAYGRGADTVGEGGTAAWGAGSRDGVGERRDGFAGDGAGRRHGVPGSGGSGRGCGVICAAVVAASPASLK